MSGSPVPGRRRPSDWSDCELVARLAFGTRVDRDRARTWLDRSGGLRGLIDGLRLDGGSDARELPLALREGLIGAVELADRYWSEGVRRGYSVADPGDARRYVRARLARYEREVFAGIFLDNQHRLLAYEELFYGTIDGASIRARS